MTTSEPALIAGMTAVTFGVRYFLFALATAAAGVRTRNLLATIAIGLAALFVYRLFL